MAGNPIGISLWNWTPVFGGEQLDLIDKAAELGFTSVEIPADDPTVDVNRLAKKIRYWGLRSTVCASLTSGRDLSSFDDDVRKQTKEYLRWCCRMAAEIGAGIVGGPLYGGGGKAHFLDAERREKEFELAAEGLHELGEYAKSLGVSLAVEPIHRYRTSVVNTAGQALELVDRIGCCNVGILFDTYHANIEEENPIAALRKVLKAKKLLHFHACENNRDVPGRGHLNWKEITKLLLSENYGGSITMETFVPGGLDACWRELPITATQRAQQGLRYLQELLGG